MKLLLATSLVFMVGKVAANNKKDYAGLDEPCTLKYHVNGAYYKPETAQGKKDMICDPEPQADGSYLSCSAAEFDTGIDPESGNGVIEITGFCDVRACAGLDDADDIDSTSFPKGETSATERVTICHRTCSAHNPWVRITIDNDAWQKGDELCGEANGHQPDGTFGHQISDCNVEDTSPWGSNTGDYLIKWHGTRQNVADGIANGTITDYNSEKSYWQYWERACPYVRQFKNGGKACCNNADYSDCCGGPFGTPEEFILPSPAPSKYPTQIPSLEPTKVPTSGVPTGGCPVVSTAPEDSFSKVLHITFNGVSSGNDHGHDTIEEFLTEVNTTFTTAKLEEAIKSTYNKMGGYGVCQNHTVLVDNVSIDTDSSVRAMNKEHDMVARRITATVSGWCTECQEIPFLPANNCIDVTTTYCPACIDLNGGVAPGKIQIISGLDLLTSLNEEYYLVGTQAEIIRMQGDILGETTCGTGYQYILSNGNVKCIG